MNVKAIIDNYIEDSTFFPILITLVLSTLYIGYAPSSISLGILCLSAVYYAFRHKRFKPKSALFWPILIYIFFALSFLWSVNKGLTQKGLGRTVVLLLIPLIFFTLPKFNKQNLNFVLKYYTINNTLFGLFFLLCAFINFIKSGSFTVFTYHDLVSVLELNAIYVSIYFLISFAYLLSIKQKSKYRTFLLIFFLGMILLLSSKIILIALIIISIIYGYRNRRKIRLTKQTILVVTLMSLIALITSKELANRFLIEKSTNLSEVISREKFNKVYPWTGTSIRLLQGRILLDQIREEGIFWKGLGLFASRENMVERHLGYNTYKGYHKYNYHNQYAQILSETGIFGLILLLLLLISNIYKAFKSKHLVFIAFSVAIPILFLTESFLWVHKGIIFFTLLFCLFQNTEYFDQDTKIDEHIK